MEVLKTLKICAKSNLLMILKYLQQLEKAYENMQDEAKVQQTREMITQAQKMYWGL